MTTDYLQRLLCTACPRRRPHGEAGPDAEQRRAVWLRWGERDGSSGGRVDAMAYVLIALAVVVCVLLRKGEAMTCCVFSAAV